MGVGLSGAAGNESTGELYAFLAELCGDGQSLYKNPYYNLSMPPFSLACQEQRDVTPTGFLAHPPLA
ncbi:hypothetical protein SPRA44_90064 [Serratia proteamaculans]|nr:hypothetical protein SPRA44_90064 [Serratia proteamaculans]